jgi:hypothetical protein
MLPFIHTAHYHSISDMHGVNKATVRRAIKNVVNVVNRELYLILLCHGQKILKR